MGFLTGKPATQTSNSQSNSQSTNSSLANNQYYPQAQATFGSTAGQTAGATNSMAALLGGNGSPAQSQAFDNFRNGTGYQFQMDQGTQAINGNQAARGLLDSGSTAKALTTFGQGTADQSFQQYMNNLKGVADTGLQAGQLIGGTGQQSKSQGQSTSASTSTGNSSGGKKGLLDYAATGAGLAAASDRRLKKDIQWLDKLYDGLNVYQYHYINGSGPHIGVMADEVATIKPEALGPVIGGYMTVDYNKIGFDSGL